MKPHLRLTTEQDRPAASAASPQLRRAMIHMLHGDTWIKELEAIAQTVADQQDDRHWLKTAIENMQDRIERIKQTLRTEGSTR